MPAAGETLRLAQDDAVRRAVERHPAVAAASRAAEGARWRASQAKTAWIPRLSVEASYRYAGPLPELVVDTGITPPGSTSPLVIQKEVGTLNNAAAGVRVGWRAFDFFARDARIDAAGAAARASEAEEDQRAADIAFAVRAAYLSALLYAQVEEITQRSLEVARQALDEETVRREAGIGDDVAVASAQTRVAELEARLVDATQERLRSLDALRLLLGLPAGTAVEPSDKLEDLGRAEAPTPSAEAPALRRLGWLERAVEHEKTGVARSFFPTIDLFGKLDYQYPKTFLEDDQAGLAYAAGVSLTWDLFDGDLRRRKKAELAARSAELRELRRAAEEEMARKVDEADSHARSAAAREQAAEKSVDAAQVYLVAAQAALGAGTGTALDVRRAEEAVDKARLALVSAHFETAMASAQKLQACGAAFATSQEEMSR